MERRRVVITGLGAVTPIGLPAAESWQAVKDGVCGIAPITQFDPTDLKVHLAAEVKGFVPENYMSKPEAKRMGRFTQMAVVSAKEALDGAGFTLDEAEADRCGVIVSSGIGGLGTLEELFEVWTWGQLGYHAKPLGLLEVNGFYSKLGDFLDHLVAERFVRLQHREMLQIADSPQDLLDCFCLVWL